MLKITVNGTEYECATTLRVAYELQGRFNHMAYTKIFENLGDMKLEEQLRILYTALKVKNPDAPINENQFIASYLENSNVKEVMSQLKVLIQAIMGTTDEEVAAAEAKVAATEGPEGN